MDVVYIVRPGESNDELRYSLRSLANLKHEQVWIVGHTPTWVTGVRSLDTVQRGPKWTNGLNNWLAAVEHPDMPPAFVLMNDDFYIMEPLSVLPVWHGGPLRDQATADDYGRGLLRTAALLEGTGVDVPLSYELHVPMVVDTNGWALALGPKIDDERLAPRSIYGNFAELGGERHEDVKVRNLAGNAPAASLFLSSTDISFPRMAPALREAFPDRGPYERPAR